MASVGTNPLDDSTVVFSPYWKSDFRRAIKRGLDVLAASFLLILFSPLFLLLGIAVRLEFAGKNFLPLARRRRRRQAFSQLQVQVHGEECR